MSVRARILQGGATRWADLRACMAEPDFAAYTAGHFASNIAFWMQRIAIGWLVWTLTGSKAWLGFVAFAELFPSLLSSFIGGELADRFSRPRMFFFGSIGSTTVSFLLFWWHFNGELDVWSLTGLMVVLGVIAGINLPPRLSMPHELVPNALLSSALAVNSSTFNLSRLLGPAVAAPMLWLWGAEAVFFAAFLANAVFVVSLGRIAWRRAAVVISGPRAPLLTVLSDLSREKVVVAVIVLQFAQGALVRPASEMFPAFADKVFAMGETALALLNAALGLGAILGAFAFARPRSDRDALRTIMSTSLALALSLAAFALTRELWVALLILVMHGAMMSGSNNAAMAYVQLHTPRERLGRVLALYGMVFRVAPAIGALAFGLTAEVLGLGATTLAFAVFGLATTLHYWQTVVATNEHAAPRVDSGGAPPAGLQARAAAPETR